MALLLNQIEWSEPLLPAASDPELEPEAKRIFGDMPNVVARVMHSRWIARFYMDLFCTRFVAAPMPLLDLAGFVTAQENSCRYCYGATRAALKVLGYSEEQVTRIERAAELAELDDRERQVIRFCRQLARSNPRPGELEIDTFAKLGHSPEVIKEVCFYVATQCFSNRVATMLAVPPEARLEKLSGSLLGRFLRPVIARMLRRKPASRLDDKGALGGPYAGVVQAFAGLPCAAPLRAALDGAFSSKVLPRRTVTLLFAVVSHSLGCNPCGGEARRLMGAEGFDPVETEQILANLGAPSLTALENTLVLFARDTVHYKTPAIQQRARALRDELGADVILEAIGTTALANAVVRLGMLAQR
jgi:alkylhydroperoxidase family enzyme